MPWPDEPKTEMNRRLHREKRYEAFRIRVDEFVKEGLGYKEARAAAVREFPPLDDSEPVVEEQVEEAQADDHESEPCGIPFWTEGGVPDESLTYWDMLEWVCSALGRKEDGKPVTRKQCPNDKAWGLFVWATRCKEDFYKLYVQEGRKQSEREREVEDAKRWVTTTVDEIRALLESVKENMAND